MKKHKPEKKQATSLAGQAVVVAWYRPEQWDRLRAVAADPEKLLDTFAEWLNVAESTLQNLRAAGIQPYSVDVDVEELLLWCKQQGVPLDQAARSRYAREKDHEMLIHSSQEGSKRQ